MSDEIYLENDDVVSVSQAGFSLSNTTTSTVSEIKSFLRKTWPGDLHGWIFDGIACRVLSGGKGWQAGRIRLRLEFTPSKPKLPEQKPSTATSEPVSPLDDLRSQLDIE
ncbi:MULTISPECIES: KGK domain-containing protein [unclassified Nostoc]|uniref:KGK domain-containing protein n=1 Tax=unclassified Nostoc TaxID=2593658 RepID=UPI00262053E8|nr:KGK domain-containing protein [Nostoc sp. S13]MDF5736787.1 KGK domain-containing protein [Nostoc sp. S13]